MKRSFLALFSMLLLAMVPASFAIQEQQPDFSQLERCIAEELKETNTPGATVAIVSGDRVIYARGFGVSNMETGTPMKPGDSITVSASAPSSITRQFGWYVILNNR